jgi:hypothetical protein
MAKKKHVQRGRVLHSNRLQQVCEKWQKIEGRHFYVETLFIR